MDDDGKGDGTPYNFELEPWKAKPHEPNAAAFRLTALPMELQLEVIDHVDLRGLVALRRTYRLFRFSVITRGYLLRRFTSIDSGNGGVTRIPAMDTRLKYCCSQCLIMPGADLLLLEAEVGYRADGEQSSSPHPLEGVVIGGGEQHRSSNDYGWKTLCHRCWRPRLRHDGPKPIDLNSRWEVPTCILCGWPCPACYQRPRVHPACRARRRWLKAAWFLLGLVQFVFGCFGAVASWSVYRDDPRSLVPASINFGLLLISGINVAWELGFKTTRYKWPLALEFAQAVIWLPPMIANAQYPKCDPDTHFCDSFLQASLVVYIVNFIFRVLNTVGYAMLACNYDFRNLFLPDLPKGKKIMYAFVACWVWWAVVP
ncbi:uncharacterized protein PG986_011098 [Apiospora aurea]|uniref:F-box domain-containing protein n=1 Tax=Apiospora aurea TaxID=335848 RepID=A0ABR1Q4B3_9PEZI